MGLRPLSFLNPGDEAVVVEIRGGRGLQRRLSSMGLAPGKKVRVVSSSPCGPVLLAVGDTRLAMGRGQTHAVIVTSDE